MRLFQRHFKLSFAFSLVGLLSGCIGSGVTGMSQPESAPSYQRIQAIEEHQQGAIFHPSTALGLYEDMKARRVGDILTVMLVEQTSGQNSADNSVSNTTDMSVATPTFGGSARPNMAIDLGSENSFNGQFGSSQSNSLNGSISVTVHGVLPNGNLIVEGEKWIRINQGNEFIRLEGVIRPKDIDTNNMLYSTQIADARISYGGTGTHGNTPGWAAKILFSPIWPF